MFVHIQNQLHRLGTFIPGFDIDKSSTNIHLTRSPPNLVDALLVRLAPFYLC